jgi:hypothetical protein
VDGGTDNDLRFKNREREGVIPIIPIIPILQICTNNTKKPIRERGQYPYHITESGE